MKDTFTDASKTHYEGISAESSRAKLSCELDFPRTADGRVYHLGVRHGEVANRIVSPQRALVLLDSDEP